MYPPGSPSRSPTNSGPFDAGLLQILDQIESLRQLAAEAAEPPDDDNVRGESDEEVGWSAPQEAWSLVDGSAGCGKETERLAHSRGNEVQLPPLSPTNFPSLDVFAQELAEFKPLHSVAQETFPLPLGSPIELPDEVPNQPSVDPLVRTPLLPLPPAPLPPLSVAPPTSSSTTFPIASATPYPHRARSSHKRTVGEFPMVCNTCGAPSGTFLLHGSTTALAAAHETIFTCAACDLATSFDAAGSFVVSTPAAEDSGEESYDLAWRKRKNSGPAGPGSISCNACTALLGVGGIRIVDAVAERERGGKVVWIEPDFGVEPICASCFESFSWCTECGGGGRFRTGKWRPKELFQPRRRTCSLAHDRTGQVDYAYEVFETPTEIFSAVLPKHNPTTFLSFLETFWMQRYLNTRAKPLLMLQLGLFPYPLLEERARASWGKARVMMTERGAGTNRRFLCLVWAVSDAPKTKKHRKEAEHIPWVGGAHPGAPDAAERRAALVGISNCELNPSHGTLHISYSIGDNYHVFTAVGICVERILAEPRAPDQPPLKYLWMCNRHAAPADPAVTQESEASSSSRASSAGPSPATSNPPPASVDDEEFGFRPLRAFLDSVDNPPPAEYFDRKVYYPEDWNLREEMVVETATFLRFVEDAKETL
ncbi:hypothetical protein BDK51DRAFT_47859 [Blyttiomyces helicus]|uniref:Uncharacterized protein n=1 Tax=Blyttiomyces helicus TaxID=388810 RepID=A0A4P9W432_9FUNG|nr:hypothetical protein BDK51DRAFT_47859 [Blyttiomyces helicus]|eukprot:RKO85588.1 hypothetical protein BDK51DRAFT_47859 [Blyttiomyces helicus]